MNNDQYIQWLANELVYDVIAAGIEADDDLVAGYTAEDIIERAPMYWDLALQGHLVIPENIDPYTELDGWFSKLKDSVKKTFKDPTRLITKPVSETFKVHKDTFNAVRKDPVSGLKLAAGVVTGNPMLIATSATALAAGHDARRKQAALKAKLRGSAETARRPTSGIKTPPSYMRPQPSYARAPSSRMPAASAELMQARRQPPTVVTNSSLEARMLNDGKKIAEKEKGDAMDLLKTSAAIALPIGVALVAGA